MEISNLQSMYIAELQELASVERQLAACLPRVAEAASHPALKTALIEHAQETETQTRRLEAILERHGANPNAHTDQAMQAMIGETAKTLSMLNGNEVRDAGLVASVQRLKHYEIAAYGTVAALAGQLQLNNDQLILRESLREEKRVDAALTALAESEVNPDALAA
jgi:ferritin-like metal-binding protein YciE